MSTTTSSSSGADPCGPSNCAGCCDGAGVCRPGDDSDLDCGKNGAACQACTPFTGECVAGVCVEQ